MTAQGFKPMTFRVGNQLFEHNLTEYISLFPGLIATDLLGPSTGQCNNDHWPQDPSIGVQSRSLALASFVALSYLDHLVYGMLLKREFKAKFSSSN